MIRKKLVSLSFVSFLIIAVIPISSIASSIGTVSGYVYLDDEICNPEEIVLSFPEHNITADLFTGGFYVIDFSGDVGETGIFIVTLDGSEYTAIETITIQQGIIVYEIDLHITSQENDTEPPCKVTNLTVTDAKDGKLDLSWDAATDNVAVDHYKIYRNNSFLTITTGTTYQDTGLTNGLSYCYNVSAVDTSDNEGERSAQECGVPTTSSTTNNPPNTPSNPSPGESAINININAVLSWTGGDPDSDPVTYDVYFGTSSNPAKVSSNQSNTVHTPETMNKDTKYYWRIVAWDDKDANSSGPLWNFTTKTNSPPNKPTTPKPENNSENIGLTTQLSVFVTDPDGDILSVSFYNAANDALIDSVNNVQNATKATCYWSGLEYYTDYYWYAVANDSESEVYSDVFTFKTIEEDNTKPTVSIEKPEEGSFYFFGNLVFPGVLKIPFILGKVEIVVNAVDDQSGISRVELSIKGKLREINEDLTEYPYTYEWSRFSFGKYNLTATAYDMNGNSASTSIVVRKFL